MSDPAPRRRRTNTPPPSRNGSPLPWIALVIGVIVAGLGIGALISAFQNRGTPNLPPSAPTVTAVPQATPESPAPAPLETVMPIPSPTGTPPPTPAPHPTRKATASPGPTATATPSASAVTPPSVAPSATAAPTPPPTIEPTAKPVPVATAVPTRAPTPVPTPTPTAAPTVAPTPKPASGPDAVVRRYLDALMAGDVGGAGALLTSGNPHEAAFVDPNARITSVRTTQSDGSGSTVLAEIATPRGTYLATFHVTAAGKIDQHEIVELLRLDAPSPRPQAIAFDGALLWLGSIETERLYAMRPNDWTVADEMTVPGKPWGMTVAGDELCVILGQTDEDHRSIFRAIPGHGVRTTSAIPCPDDTGSHLSYDGDALYVSQWYNRKLIAIDDRGTPGLVIDVPHQIVGQTIVNGHFYLITTEDESEALYWLTRVDARGEKPVCEDLAEIRFDARGLAFDGERFWTNHREKNQTVAFAKPD
jgi:hypothetical protein